MKGKKLIAFLLAIFMLAGILPAAPGGLTASASGDLEVIVDFREVYDSAAADQDGDGSYVAVNPVYETHGWNFNTSKTVAHYLGDGNVGVRTGAADNSVTSCSSWLQINMAVKTSPNDITFNIDAKTAGTYDFSMDAHHFSLGAELLIYVNDEYVGTVNTRSGTANAINTTSFGKVYLKQGENTVTFTRDGGEYQFLLQKLSFTNGIAEASYGFDKVVLTPAKLTLNKGDTMTVKGGVLMTNGVYKIMNGAYNPGVNGTYQWESVAKKNICELISSDAAVGTVAAVGSTSAGELTYTFTAHKAGITNLILTTKVDGVDKTVNKIIEVVDPAETETGFTIDFAKEWIKAGGTGGNVLPVTQTLEEDGWQINKEMTNANIYGDGNGENGADTNSIRMQSPFIDLWLKTTSQGASAENDCTFDIKAPAAGVYRLKIENYHQTGGAEIAVFVNKEYMGFVSTKAGTSGENYTTEFNCVELNAGTNTITFRKVGGTVMNMKKIIFEKIDSLPTFEKVTLEADKLTLKVGDTAEVKYGALMSDGSYKRISGYLYSGGKDSNNVDYGIAVSDENVLSKTQGENKMGQAVNSVTAKAVGYSVVSVKYVVNGQTYNKEIGINVIGDNDIPANFGNTYAYIREVNDGRTTSYKLVLLSAIDSLDYKKVGFKIDGDIGVSEKATQNVYNSIVVNGTTYTAADFGLTAEDYIFSAELDITPAQAGEVIAFNAFATPLEGDEIAGAARAISVVAE